MTVSRQCVNTVPSSFDDRLLQSYLSCFCIFLEPSGTTIGNATTAAQTGGELLLKLIP